MTKIRTSAHYRLRFVPWTSEPWVVEVKPLGSKMWIHIAEDSTLDRVMRKAADHSGSDLTIPLWEEDA